MLRTKVRHFLGRLPLRYWPVRVRKGIAKGAMDGFSVFRPIGEGLPRSTLKRLYDFMELLMVHPAGI